MNQVDLVIAGALIVFVLIGALRGFIKEVGAVCGYFVSLWVAGQFYIQGAVFLRPFFVTWPIGGELAGYAASFIAIFFICQIVVGIVVGLADVLVKMLGFIPFLKTINRAGGAAVGFIEGILIVSIVVFMIGKYPFSVDFSKQLKASTLAPHVAGIGAMLSAFLPDATKLMPSIFDMKSLPTSQMKLEDWQRMMPEAQK